MRKNRRQRKLESQRLRIENSRLKEECSSLTKKADYLGVMKDREQERADKFEQKYFDKLKQQMQFNQKDVVTLSLMVSNRTPWDDMYMQSRVPKEVIDDYYKRNVTQMLAESLYNNWECLRKTESQIGTRLDLMLLKWNNEEARREYEDMKRYMMEKEES